MVSSKTLNSLNSLNSLSKLGKLGKLVLLCCCCFVAFPYHLQQSNKTKRVSKNIYISMNTFRYILSMRYTCPQCGIKHTFTRYIDTENNIYIIISVIMYVSVTASIYKVTTKIGWNTHPIMTISVIQLPAILRLIAAAPRSTEQYQM